MTFSKRMPVPVTFLAVLAVVLALIIFFGAWAVSADVSNQRTLAFGLPGTTPTISGGNLASNDPESNAGPYQIARLDGQGEPLDDGTFAVGNLKPCYLDHR